MRNITLLSCLILAIPAIAQQCGSNPWVDDCATTIHPYTMAYTGTDTLHGGYWCAWVCPGDTLHISGAELSVWVETGGTVIIDSTAFGGIAASEIALKEGASLIVNVDSTGNGFGPGPWNQVWVAPTATVVDPFGWFLVNTCSTVTFDYSEAPAAGCDTDLTGISDSPAVAAPVLRHDPDQQRLVLDLPPGRWQALLVDVRGAVVQRLAGAQRMEFALQTMPLGIYSAVLTRGGMRHVHRIVVR